MTFAAPHWLWAFAIFPVLIALVVAGERRRVELLAKLVAARLQPKLAGNVSMAKRRVRFVFALLGLAFAILALARPQWGFTWEEAKRKGRDVIIAIDTSRSMLADDIKPDRLTRAKLAAQDLIGELTGDRVGVIAFAGTAFLQAPLTVDYTAALSSLKELDTEIIPQGGSNLEGALRAAREAFGKGESENRALVIFSDGEELDADAKKAVDELKGQVRVFGVGVGTPEGALIPVRTRGRLEFVQDDTGNPVRTRLDESRLRAVAEATGGFYVRLQTGRAEMQHIMRDGLGTMTEQEIDARLSRRPIERFQWPLAAGLAALAVSLLIGERRRVAATAMRAAIFAMLMPHFAQAAWWPKNRGLERFEEGDRLAEKAQREAAAPDDPSWDPVRKAYAESHDEFAKQLKRRPNSPEAHYNLGTTAYKTRQLDDAMTLFSEALTSNRRDVQVNSRDYLGNTLYQRGAAKEAKEEKLADWREGVRQYDEALKLEPENKMVQGHREFLLKKIEELEKEEQKQDEQKQDEQKKDDQKKDDEKKDEKNDQQKDQQQKKDDQQQQKKDQQGSEQKDQQQQKDSPGEQKEQKEGKEQESKEQQGQQGKEQEAKEQEGKDQKGEQGKEQKDQQGQKGEQGQQKEQGGKPEPMPAQPQEPKKEGELKSAPQAGEAQEPTEAEQAQADAQAAAEGRMTMQQAKALLDSLKSEDAKVRLVDPREKQGLRKVWKDW